MSGDELLVLARSRGTGASEWQWRTVPNGATNLPSSYMPAGVPFHVACVPGKGFGLVASRRLQAGNAADDTCRYMYLHLTSPFLLICFCKVLLNQLRDTTAYGEGARRNPAGASEHA